MQPSKEEQVAWVKAVAGYLGISLTELARRAKLAPSTLQRPVNDSEYAGMISGRTLAAVADVAKLRVLEFPGRMRGMGEDAAPFTYDARPDAADNLNRAVRELCSGRNGRDPWIVKSFVLDASGILPGDVLIVDLNKQAQPRDIVCAQIYDWGGRKAETVFRLYTPPFLMTSTLRGPIEKPVAVDNETVVIKGTVTHMLRAFGMPDQ